MTSLVGEIPSPTAGVWNLGPLPVRGYAICILAGIVVALWITQRRLEDRGGTAGQALDVAAWAVPFGIVGGRLYHLVTSPQAYFGAGGHPLNALKVWEGGLGIWGAVALGALGAWIGCRRRGVRFLDFVDAAAPGVLVAQAIGRWGNYFNNEIHGSETTLPWGLKVYDWDQQAGHAVLDAAGNPVVAGVFHPTFLYESIFCLLLALALVLLDRRTVLRRGQIFALYVAGYPVGRLAIELMRTDDANRILGLRVNVWVSVLVFLLGAGLYVLFGRRSDQALESSPDSPDSPDSPPQPAPERPAQSPVSHNVE